MEMGREERGDARLLRDLAALESLVDRRPGARTRLQRELGESTARGIVASLSAALAPQFSGARTARRSQPGSPTRAGPREDLEPRPPALPAPTSGRASGRTATSRGTLSCWMQCEPSVFVLQPSAAQILSIAIVVSPSSRSRRGPAVAVNLPQARHPATSPGLEERVVPDRLVLLAEPPHADPEPEAVRERDARADRLRVGVPDVVVHAAPIRVGEVAARPRRDPTAASRCTAAPEPARHCTRAASRGCSPRRRSASRSRTCRSRARTSACSAAGRRTSRPGSPTSCRRSRRAPTSSSGSPST